MGRWGLLLAVVWLACAATQTRAQERDPIQVGAWSGGAFTDEDGRYLYCAVGARHPNGIDMILYWWESGFSLSLHNDDWQLPEDGAYTVSAAIDRRWSSRITGEAMAGSGIHFDLGHDADAVGAFRLGHRLTVDTAQTTLRFDLTGTNAAIGAIQACDARQGGGRSRSAETDQSTAGRGAGQAEPAPETVTGSDYRRFAQPNVPLDMLRDLLTANISVLIKVMPAPDGLSHYEFFAPTSAGHIRGSYVELDPGTSSTVEIMTDHLAVSQLTCPGRFASGSEPPVAFGSSLVQRAFTACEISDTTLHESFTILNLQTFVQIYLISSDDEGQETAALMADELYGTLEEFAYYLTQSE